MAKNSEKTHESAQKQTSANRSNKTLQDAKLKAIGMPSVREGNNPYCKVCKDSGSLLMCGHCTRSYHLHCANMLEPDIPAGTWFCSYCVPYMDKKLRDEYAKLEKTEKAQKESKIKHCAGKLNNVQKDITVKWFEKKYPEYVKQGKLVYPIEDQLIKIESELYQIPLPPPLPLPSLLPYPSEQVGDMLFIVDFVHTFGKLLQLTPFTVEQLCYALNSNTQTMLIKELHMSLIKLLINHILSRENTYEGLSGESKFLFSAAQLSEIFDITDFLPYSWLTLLDELLRLPIFKEYVEDTIVDSILAKKDESALDVSYFDYSFKERTSIILLLINCLFDVKELHEELSKRLEQKGDLAKEKAKINVAIKEIELKLPEMKGLAATRKASSMTEKIQKLQNKIEDINKKLETIHLRTNPIGLDRDYNEYFFFKWDPKRLYVKMVTPVDESSASKLNEAGYWYAFTRSNSVDQLLQCLCPKGTRESKLIEGIKWAKDKLKLTNGDDSSTSSDMQLDEPNGRSKGTENYANKDSEFENVEGSIEVLRHMMLNVEKKFTKYLQKGNKQWENYERIEEWKREVLQAEDAPTLALLLVEHAQKSSSPLRLASSSEESGDSDEERVYTQKYRKVTIRIWQDLGDYYSIWENLTQSTTTLGQLALVIAIYQEVLEQYTTKKQESGRNETEVKKKVKQEERPRVTRSEVKKIKIDKPKKTDKLEHEDNCYFCDDGGKLICCETCPKVVHPSCIGLKKIPDEDWYCDACKTKDQYAPQTRLRTRLRKIAH